MAFLEKYLQAKQEAQEGKEQERPDTEEQKLSLKQILADPELSVLFGKYLEGLQQEKLASRLMGARLKESDIDVLEQIRKKFNEVLKRCRRVEQFLLSNERFFDRLLRSPDLQKIANLVGKEELVNIVLGQLKELAVANPSAFRRIEQLLTSIEDIEKRIEERGERIQELASKWGIRESELLKVLQIADKQEREREIKRLMREGIGLIRYVIRYLRGGKISLESLGHNRVQIEQLLQQLDRMGIRLGTALAIAIKGREEMRKVLAEAIAGEEEPGKEEKMDFQKAREVLAPAPYLKEEILKKWEEWKRAHPRRLFYSDQEWVDVFGRRFVEDFVRKKVGEELSFWQIVAKSLLWAFFKQQVRGDLLRNL